MLRAVRGCFSKLASVQQRRFSTAISPGKTWEDRFKPWDISADLEFQAQNKKMLDEIDSLRSQKHVTAAAAAAAAQQSLALEGNPLELKDSEVIYRQLEQGGHLKKAISIICNQMQLKKAVSGDHPKCFPQPEKLLPGAAAAKEAVIQLRNHLFVSSIILERRLFGYMGEEYLKDFHKILFKDTAKELQAGSYRSVQLNSEDPLTVYPYPAEVPELIRHLFEWRWSMMKSKELHPLLVACKLSTTFLRIQPFDQGNGLMGRVLGAEFMARDGYPCPVIPDFDKAKYAVAKAETGDATPYYQMVIGTLTNMLT